MLDDIIGIVNMVTGGKKITEKNIDDNLIELGLDSISFIRMVVLIEEKYKCEIPDSYLVISKMNTMSMIIKIMEEVLGINESAN